MGKLDKLFKTARSSLRTARLSLNEFIEELQKTPKNDYGDIAKMIGGILGAEEELDKFEAAIHEEAQEVEAEDKGPRLVPGSVAGTMEGFAVTKGESLRELLEGQSFDFDKHMDSLMRDE